MKLPHVLALALVAAAAAVVAAPARSDSPTPVLRHGVHVSGAANAVVHRRGPRRTTAAPVTCSGPGGTNFTADCAGPMPVNEPSIATNGSQFVAGANDYNSYNGQGQDGFYWSADGVTWNDGGPIDVFPHGPNTAAGDPGVAIDADGVVYYSSLLFDANDCSVGGVELLRRDPASGAWSYAQLAANSSGAFQDKPAIALGANVVYVSWSHFGSCSGEGVTSPIQVAVLPTGVQSVPPTAVLDVPGSTYSQGSSIAADGSGGFWISWEEFPTSSSTSGEIRLAHRTPIGWEPFATNGGNAWESVSPASFRDLPSPLPGFSFRTDSFPSLAVVGGTPWVAWASSDNGVGRVHLWSGGPGAPAVADAGGDQFFPALAADGSGGAFVSFGQTAPDGTYDWYLAHGASVTRISQTSSTPNADPFFAGQFVGDYSGIAVHNGAPYPIWTAVVPGALFPQMETVVYSVRTPTAPGAPTLAPPTAGNGLLHLRWTAPADDGGTPITAYRVYRGTAAGGESPVATVGATTSWDDVTVVAGTLYYYRVAAVNSVGEGPPSSEVSAPADLTVPIVAGGSPVTVTTTLAGENARLPFTGTSGELVSVQLTGSTLSSGTLSILRPDGTTLVSKPFFGTTGFLDRTQLPADGTYTVLVDPTASAVGSATVTLNVVPPDATASMVPAGASVTVATTVPGQNALLTFPGAAGEAVALQLSGVTISSGTVSLVRPDGTTLVTKPFATTGLFLDKTVLPATGTYRIALDPTGAAVGSVTATLYDVPPDVTGTIVVGGPAVSVTNTVPGQNSRLTFSGSAGESVGVNVSNVTILSGTVAILRPDGTTLASKPFSTAGAFLDRTQLPVSGTYTILVDPSGASVGTATLKIADVPPDVTGTIVAGGPPVTVMITAPGQNARLTFQGTAGESVSLQLSAGTIASGTVSILRPDGTVVVTKPFATTGAFVDRTSLPVGGTYTVLVDPANAAVGSATATLYNVPPDFSGTITAGGSPVTVTITIPGQNARLTFNGAAGQIVTVTLSSVTIPSGILSVLKPGGVALATKFFFTAGGSLSATLPVDGTYTILVDPANAGVGGATATLA